VNLLAIWAAVILVELSASGQRIESVLGSRADMRPVPANSQSRVTWDISVSPHDRSSRREYDVYIDGVRRRFLDVKCDSLTGDSLTCSAPLPALPPGRHILEVVTVTAASESARSAPLVIVIAGEASALDVSDDERRQSRSGDSDEAPRVVDIALLPDGRMIAAERNGRVRIIEARGTPQHSALVLRDVHPGAGLGLLGVAVHPDHARNKYVYLVYVARTSDDRAVYRVLRMREAGNTLGEPAVLIDNVPATLPAGATVRFGPDGKLYVAFAAASSARHPYSGTILRLQDDGLTPWDSQLHSPIYMRGVGVPLGLAWSPDGRLWLASVREGTSRLERIGGPVYAFGGGAVAGGLAMVQDPADRLSSLWVARSDQPGFHALALDRPLPAELPAVIPLRASSAVGLGCLVADGRGSAYACVTSPPGGGIVRLEWPR
jgi:hypothetical protein